MNIEFKEIRALRSLLSKEDKYDIASKLNFSKRTVDAVLDGTRTNDTIENEIINLAKKNITHYQLIINNVCAKNQTNIISVEKYNEIKNNTAWTYGYVYMRYMDIYLQFSHIKFNTLEEFFSKIETECNDIMQHPYYVIDIAVRLIGITPHAAINALSKKANLQLQVRS